MRKPHGDRPGLTGTVQRVEWWVFWPSWATWGGTTHWHPSGACGDAFCCCLLRVGFLLGLLFHREDADDKLLQNAGWRSPDCSALYPRRWNSSWAPLWDQKETVCTPVTGQSFEPACYDCGIACFEVHNVGNRYSPCVVCSVSFIVRVVLCAVFCLSVVCYFVWCVIVVPLPPSKNPFAIKINNKNNWRKSSSGIWCRVVMIRTDVSE
jgi:hypothetical protein